MKAFKLRDYFEKLPTQAHKNEFSVNLEELYQGKGRELLSHCHALAFIFEDEKKLSEFSTSFFFAMEAIKTSDSYFASGEKQNKQINTFIEENEDLKIALKEFFQLIVKARDRAKLETPSIKLFEEPEVIESSVKEVSHQNEADELIVEQGEFLIQNLNNLKIGSRIKYIPEGEYNIVTKFFQENNLYNEEYNSLVTQVHNQEVIIAGESLYDSLYATFNHHG